MKLSKTNKDMLSQALMFLSIAAVIFSGVGWVGTDIWLASTQWLLVATVSALFATYLKVS